MLSLRQTLTANVRDTALVFEGGGMRAAVTSAVVTTLLTEAIHFDWVAGVSAGASNTVNYLSRDAVRARRSFVEFASDPHFGGLTTFLRGKGWFHAEYIYENTSLPGQALPFDWQTFCANPARMNIQAFNAKTGHSVTWTKADLNVLQDLMVRVRASSTMPIMMPPIQIEGETYFDGALNPHGGIPLSLAQEAGFEKFFIVLTQERDYVKKPVRHQRLLRQYFRSLPALADAVLARPSRYNATKEEIFELEKAGKAYLFVPKTMPITNREKKIARLAAAHELGLAQAQSEVGAWRDFLGLAPKSPDAR